MGKHKNQIQEETFLKFMEEHQDLAKGFVKGDRVVAESLWSELMKKLNSQGPPQKDCTGWKKVWLDWRRCIRKKIAHNKFENRATVRGQYNNFVLTSTEKAIAQLCGIYTSVEGIPKSVSFGINDNDQKIEAISSDNDAETSMVCHFSTRKRKRDDNIHDSTKKHKDSEASAVENISETMKQVLQNSENNTKVITENNIGLPIVHQYLEKINALILQQNTLMVQQNEDRRKHYLAMQQSALERNEIERKMLEIEKIKFKKEYGDHKILY